MTFMARDYWPAVPLGKIYKFHYKDAGPQYDTTVPAPLPDMSTWFVWDSDGSLLYVDYDKDMVWKDTWYIKFQLNGQIDEWKDEDISNTFFCPKKKIVFSSPIGWSPPGTVEFGPDYVTYPKSDFFKCCPPQLLKGWQSVRFEKHLDSFTTVNGQEFKDVITMIYQQGFGKKTYGARYWMARAIGPVAVQWIAPNPDKTAEPKIVITNRLDAQWTIDNGTKKDIQT